MAPQVNGVLRTLTSVELSARRLGAETGFLTPDGFPGEAFRPDVIHVGAEGTIGHRARAYCLRHGRPFDGMPTACRTS